MISLRHDRRNGWTRACANVLTKVQRQWRVIGVLIFLWVFIFYFSRSHLTRAHEVTNLYLEFEDALSLGREKVSRLHPHGFLEWAAASPYCGSHKWKPFPDRGSRRKIYDLVMVNSELDWLEICLNELHNHVDYSVVLESATTFTGHPKPLAVGENWPRVEKFGKHIIYHVLENAPELNVSWDHDIHQRNAMFTQVLPHLTDVRGPTTTMLFSSLISTKFPNRQH